MGPSKEMVKEQLIKLAHEIKRIPTSRDIREYLEVPRTIDNHWGEMAELYRDVYGIVVPHKVDRAMLYNQWTGVDKEVTLEFLDKKHGQFDYREWLKSAQATQDLHNKASSKQDIVTIKINTSKPICVVFSADWHLGSVSCDYKQFLKNIDFMLNTDGIYMGVVGDTIDNFYLFNNVMAILQQVIPPPKQRRLLSEILNALIAKNKLLFVSYGNHEIRDEKWIGDNLVSRLIEDKVPYFSSKAIIKLMVGEQMYTILAMHQTGRNSKINALHGVKQEYLNYFPADIVVTGHHHIPAIESYMHFGAAQRAGMNYGGISWLVKTGTYNADDGFSKRYYDNGVICDPCFVLSPGIKKMVPFMNVEDAVAFMGVVS